MGNSLILREVLRYVPMFRGSIFVIKISGELIEQDDLFANTIVDIALLQALGIKLVLVHGASQQINSLLEATGHKTKKTQAVEVTDPELMEVVKRACAMTTLKVVAQLSKVSQTISSIKTFNGNVVRSKRKGILGGVDHQLTGEVDFIDVDTLTKVLESNLMPVISPLAINSQGETLYLVADEIAAGIAIKLAAKKLIFMTEVDGIFVQGSMLRQQTLEEATKLVQETSFVSGDILFKLQKSIEVCQAGVSRVHFINGKRDGSLLLEIFSRDGSGTMIYGDTYTNIRSALPSDIQRIMEMAEMSVREERLVGRTAKDIQKILDQFIVYEKDDQVIGCCHLRTWPEEQCAEIAHLVVDENYRHQGIATQLIEYLEDKTKKQGLKMIFALTTRAESWFVNRQFREGSPDVLPADRKKVYDYTRNSKVMVKNL